jgi:hypothetical protein
MEYQIIKADSLSELEEKVRAAIAEGWESFGSPLAVPYRAITRTDHPYIDSIFAQAMARFARVMTSLSTTTENPAFRP